MRGLDVASSALATAVRLGAGYRARPAARRPEKLLELYEFEACPFCRRVREALSEFDLDAMIYPCPRGGGRWRARVVELGGKAAFPFLVDPGTGRSMYESADIVDYLRDTYGGPTAPMWLGPLSVASGGMAAVLRAGHGRAARPSSPPAQPLELWSFEASPFCRLVREALCELEIPYVLHNVAKGSPRREAFVARSGKMMVPYLVDANADEGDPARAGMFESADIVRYLDRYARAPGTSGPGSS
jgi:glutathione S-transferase